MSVAFVISQSYGKQDIYGALILEDIALEALRVAKLTAKQRECLHLVVLRKSSRDEAALIYARASGTYDRILYDPVGVPSDDVFGSQGNRDERSTSVMLEEIPTTYDVDISDETDFWSQIQKEPGRALGTGQRIAIIVVLTIGILAIVLIGLSVSQSLSSLLAA